VIRGKNNLTEKDAALLEKKRLKLDVEIFKEENLLDEALKNSINNIKISTATMYSARLLLSTVFPSLRFSNIKDIISPFVLVSINNLINTFNYKDKIKLKETKYDGEKVKFNKTECIDELTKNDNNNNQVAMAI